MTDPDISGSDLERRRRRALFRSEHRGMKEVDLILGGFARRELAAMDAGSLDEFERVLGEADSDILKWVTGEKPLPAEYDTPLMRRLLTFERDATA